MSRALPLLLVLAPLAAAQDPIFLSPHVPTSFQPKAVSSGDLNGDGASDVLLTRNDGSFDLHLGLGNGSFAPAVILASLPQTNRTRLLDANLDGALDIAACIDGAATDLVSLRRGLGDGGFLAPLHTAVGGGPRDLDVGDLDADGVPDLAVACILTIRLSLLFGEGDGTFVVTDLPLPPNPRGVAVGHIDVDGELDIAVVTSGGLLVPILGEGGGAFVIGPTTAAPNAVDVDLGDVDGDGDEDAGLATVTDFTQGCALALDGAFLAPFGMGADGPAAQVLMSDVDEDGDADLVHDPRGVSVTLSLGDGTLGPTSNYSCSNASSGCVADDLTGDGDIDLLVSGSGIPFPGLSYTAVLFRGDGAGHFGPQIPTGARPLGLDAGDLDDDGLPDLVLATDQAAALSVHAGLDHGVFSATSGTHPAGGAAVDVVLGDADEDGALDAFVARTSGGGSIALMPGLGDLGFGAPQAAGAMSGSTALAVRDLDLDGHLDVVAAGGGGGLEILLGDGAGGFLVSGSLPTAGAGPAAVELVALDGDAWIDLAVLNGNVPQLQVYLAQGPVSFAAPVSYFSGSNFGADLASGDADGDGDEDLVCVGNGPCTLLLNDGLGVLTAAVGVTPLLGGGGVGLADVTRDGRMDIVVASAQAWPTSTSTLSTLAVFAGIFGGVFDAPVHHAVSRENRALLLRDLDGDGAPDAAMGSIYPDFTVLLNQRGPWKDLGHALAGEQGLPRLRGFGAAQPGSAFELRITDARRGGSAWLVVGLSELAAPFKGGVLVPQPFATTGPWPLDAQGDFSLQGPWPGPASPGAQLYFQSWTPDSAAVKGWSASNALSLTLP